MFLLHRDTWQCFDFYIPLFLQLPLIDRFLFDAVGFLLIGVRDFVQETNSVALRAAIKWLRQRLNI